MFAANNGRDDCLSVLVSSRADLTIKIKYARTALDKAQRMKKQGCIEIMNNALANNNMYV
jgi:hypothetical protein